jgi:ABC-type dipeptide/oligopeptide/nickel transport system permease component
MTRFLAKRSFDALLTAFLVFSVVFFAMRILPGDPVVAMLGDRAGTETIENVRRALGLHEPSMVQYGKFLWGLLHLDLGRSLINGADVAGILARNLPYTLALTVGSTVVGISIGIPLGVASFKLAGLALAPFGKQVVPARRAGSRDNTTHAAKVCCKRK